MRTESEYSCGSGERVGRDSRRHSAQRLRHDGHISAAFARTGQVVRARGCRCRAIRRVRRRLTVRVILRGKGESTRELFTVLSEV